MLRRQKTCMGVWLKLVKIYFLHRKLCHHLPSSMLFCRPFSAAFHRRCIDFDCGDIGCCMVLPLRLISKRLSFAFRKATYCTLKDHLLEAKRWPFVTCWMSDCCAAACFAFAGRRFPTAVPPPNSCNIVRR